MNFIIDQYPTECADEDSFSFYSSVFLHNDKASLPETTNNQHVSSHLHFPSWQKEDVHNSIDIIYQEYLID